MRARARGQFNVRMLPRLFLLAFLALAGLQVIAADEQSQPKGVVIGLRRFIERTRIARADSAGGVVVPTTSCQGVGCVVDARPAVQGRSVPRLDSSSVGADEDDADGDEEDGDETDVEEGRGKKGKKKKGYGKMMMMMAAFTKAAILYLMIHAVAALAGKALIVAKVALAIATAVALKKSSDHKTSYEIVKHPQYSHSHTHSTSVDYDHNGGGGGYEGGSRRRRAF